MRRLIVLSTFAALAVPAGPALAQRATAGYTVRTTTMRAGPDYDYPAVQRVARNARVDVYGCLNDRSWCDAGYRSDRGWIPGSDLVVDHRGRRSAVSSYPGISVLAFIFGSYWDSHYRGRSFYAERPRWEQQYYNNFQPHWGPRPQAPPAFQRQNRHPAQSVRPQPQPRMQPQPQPRMQPQTQPRMQPQTQPRLQPQPQPQPRPRATDGHFRATPTQVAPPQLQPHLSPGVAPPVNPPPPPNVRHFDPAHPPATTEQHRGRKGEGEKHP
ncbi:hypothetical protein U1839_03875 [Sphingomonas sp. RT2P30]|uniref:SH3 domain-containing protein n=1 Tax=Parasphingomonas halimpatiens TaxID=3096162 RepID=UPI002FCBF7C0